MEEFQAYACSTLKEIQDDLQAISERVRQLESENHRKSQKETLSGENNRTREGSELCATNQPEPFFAGKSVVLETRGDQTSAYQLAEGDFWPTALPCVYKMNSRQ